MVLADTYAAIGSVSELLQERLITKVGENVTVGHPETSSPEPSKPRLNLFLYELPFDPFLKNTSLDEGAKPPLWLVTRYLLTAYDDTQKSDSAKAHILLGKGIRALQEMNYLIPNAGTPIGNALLDNPERLKITFNNANSELLGRIMQGTDEKYRCSISFEVRPVMIAPAEKPVYSLLVGIDSTVPRVIGEDGINIPVEPIVAPSISRIEPLKLEYNESFEIFGTNLNIGNIKVVLNSVELETSLIEESRITCSMNSEIKFGNLISAGTHTINVVQTLSSGRLRKSNPFLVNLVPHLQGATTSGLTANADSKIFGKITMTGFLLGNNEDDVIVAFYKNGQIVKSFDNVIIPSPSSISQQSLELDISTDDALPIGKYFIILRVNGQQAFTSPKVEMVV